MNKQEYLDKLTYEIGNMTTEQKEEIIAIFNEHFEQGALDGKKEEEMCRDLGSPAFVAAQFLENNREKLGNDIMQNERPEQTRDDAVWKQAEQRRSPELQSRQDINTRQDYMRLHDAGEIDIKKSFNPEYEGISKINVNMLASNINIYTRDVDFGQGDNIIVTICGQSKNSEFNVYVSGGILNIIENKKFILFNLFNLTRSVRTEIVVPQSFGGTLYVKNSAGNVGLENLRLPLTELKATAGDVRINNHVGDIELLTTAGNAHLNNVRGKINLRSTAGDIKIEDCDGSVEARTSAGNMKISTRRGHISASTSAGNIKITADEILKLNASSSAGNVKVETSKLSGDAELSSSAGNVKLEAKQVAGSIAARASLGNVTITLPRDASMRITPKTYGKCKSDFINNPDSPYTLDVSASLGSVSINSR